MDPWAQRLLKTLRVDVLAAWRKRHHRAEGVLLTGVGGLILVAAGFGWAVELSGPRSVDPKAPLLTLVGAVLLAFGAAAFWRARAVGRKAKHDMMGTPVPLPSKPGKPLRFHGPGSAVKKAVGIVLLIVGFVLFTFMAMPGLRADMPSEDQPWRPLGRLTGGVVFLIPGVLVLWWAYRDRRHASGLPPPRPFMTHDQDDAQRSSLPDDRIAAPANNRTTRPPDVYQP
jgi:hypothetical protein